MNMATGRVGGKQQPVVRTNVDPSFSLHLNKEIDHVLNDIMELHTKSDGRFFATIAVLSKFQQYIAV
jgi:hypothetical protein